MYHCNLQEIAKNNEIVTEIMPLQISHEMHVDIAELNFCWSHHSVINKNECCSSNADFCCCEKLTELPRGQFFGFS